MKTAFFRSAFLKAFLFISFILLYFPLNAFAVCDPGIANYLAFPPFVSNRVPPNILLILDNSGSMNEFAYKEVNGNSSEGTAYTGYIPGQEYYGLFNPNKLYSYDNTNHYFYVDGDAVDDPLTTNITERSTGSDPAVRKFSGNWLNWWTMRRLDVAKKVLTGGRVAPNTTDLVLEGMPTEREYRKIFNDYTTADDPESIITDKNVYYTPFHQGIYSYWRNTDRGDYSLGGPAETFVPIFTVAPATFDEASDLTGGSQVNVPDDTDYLSDPVDRGGSATDVGGSVGELNHTRKGYLVALKVDAEDLPVEGIIQQMVGRARFGYMQFNYGRGPGENKSWNGNAGSWDIDDDGNKDIYRKFTDGGRVRNYVGDINTTTDPHGDTVLQIIQNINQQNIQMMTPIEEVLWEAVKYFKQDDPAYLPEASPDTPPSNAVNFEKSNTWDPYYFDSLNDFIPCAKSYIILVSDGEGNNNDGVPSADWPSGANTDDLSSDGDGYLDDIAFNMHTHDLRDDIKMGETIEHIDQTITLYTVFTFDDSTSAKSEMMRAARAGGFNDLDRDGDPGGVFSTDPASCVCSEEWDKECGDSSAEGYKIPDTYFEAQDGGEMEEKIMTAIADILSKSASGTAASVISNARGGQGAIYQAVFFTESEAEPNTGQTVKWYGNVHTLFVDDYGYMYEDTNQNMMLDLGDYRVVFNGVTGEVELWEYILLTEEWIYYDDADITDLKFIWNSLEWMSDVAMDVTTQRIYDKNDKQRYIFTDLISGPITTDANGYPLNVDSSQQMDFTQDFANDKINDTYFFLNPYLEYDHDNNSGTGDIGLTEDQMIEEAQNIINFIRGEEGLTETGTGISYRDRTLDLDGDSIDETVYRIGDIIHSTPTIVTSPAEDYDQIYRDDTYREFRKQYLNRRTMIYAGGNDGMLHAFNGGFFDTENKQFLKQPNITVNSNLVPGVWDAGSSEWIKDPSPTGTNYKWDIGSEVWAYVPNSLLPHLKWLKGDLGLNTHVYYVDLKPRIYDANFFPEDGDHPNGWGTILIGGMRLGGAPIGVQTDVDAGGDPAPTGACEMNFTATYFALDITNPEVPPKLLWTFTDPKLGFTTSYPTPIRMKDKWFIVIGSGPDNYEAVQDVTTPVYGGRSDPGYVFVLDAETGLPATTDPYLFEGDPQSFMIDPIAIDIDIETEAKTTLPGINWSGEAIYIASDSTDPSGADGKVYRIYTDDSSNPDDWDMIEFFDANAGLKDQDGDFYHQHINTSLSVAMDDNGRIWLYFGTGRFWGNLDKMDPYFSYTNAFYGIMEPVDDDHDQIYDGTNIDYTKGVGSKDVNLMDVTYIQVEEGGEIIKEDGPVWPSRKDIDLDGDKDFIDLIYQIGGRPLPPSDPLYVPSMGGWFFDFETDGERNLGQAAVLGGLVSFTTYLPDNDVCASEGYSLLYGVYYKTGTAYTKGVLKDSSNNYTGIDTDNNVVKKISIGKGYSTKPSIHTGRQSGSRSYVQTSSGDIIGIEQENPGHTKSHKDSWQNLMNTDCD
ncbi:MAG: hypothetical protein GY729_10375 [Desulfobacteraceae bacterium]|nr:hypothetical protein [Desulfobacteraceae bacterium]